VEKNINFGDLVDKNFVFLDYETFPSKFEDCDEFAVILIQQNEKQAATLEL
jgi:hypothetical protein